MCVEVLQLRTLPLGADNPAPQGADNPPLPLPKQAQAPEGGAEFWPDFPAPPDNPPSLLIAKAQAPERGRSFCRNFRRGRIIRPRRGPDYPPPPPQDFH